MSVGFRSKNFLPSSAPKTETSNRSGGRDYVPKDGMMGYAEGDYQGMSSDQTNPILDSSPLHVEYTDPNNIYAKQHAISTLDLYSFDHAFHQPGLSISLLTVLRHFNILNGNLIQYIPTIFDLQKLLEQHVPEAQCEDPSNEKNGHSDSDGEESMSDDSDPDDELNQLEASFLQDLTDEPLDLRSLQNTDDGLPGVSKLTKTVFRLLLGMKTVLRGGIIGMINPSLLDNLIPGINGKFITDKLAEQGIVNDSYHIVQIPEFEKFVLMFSAKTAKIVRDFLLGQKGRLHVPSEPEGHLLSSFFNRAKLSAKRASDSFSRSS